MSRQTLPRFEALVVNAIRRLQAAQGSTACEIANYLNNEYDFGGPEVKRQIQLALKRGISYGIIQKSKRGYITCDLTAPPLGVSSELEETDCMRCIANNKTNAREHKGSRGRKRTRTGKKRKSKSHRSKSGKRRGKKSGGKRAASKPGSQASHIERRARSMSRNRARSDSQATDGKHIENDDNSQIDGRRSSLKKRAKAAAGRRLRAMSRRVPGSNRTSKSQKKSPPPDKAKESPPSTTSVTPAEGGKNQSSMNMDCNRSLSPSPMRSVDEIGGDSTAGTENGFET